MLGDVGHARTKARISITPFDAFKTLLANGVDNNRVKQLLEKVEIV